MDIRGYRVGGQSSRCGDRALREERVANFVRQQVEVLRHDCDEKLEDEALGAGAILAAGDDLAKNGGKVVRGLAGDIDPVELEDGPGRDRQEEVEGAGAIREVAQQNTINRIEELDVKVVNPEFVEVAKDGVGRLARDDIVQ